MKIEKRREKRRERYKTNRTFTESQEMGRKGEKSIGKSSGGAGKGRSPNDSRSQATNIFHSTRLINGVQSECRRAGGNQIGNSSDSKKKKEGKHEKAKG